MSEIEIGIVVAAKYHSTTKEGDCYKVIWEGCRKPTYEFRDKFIASIDDDQRAIWSAFLNEVKERGNHKRTPFQKCVGNAEFTDGNRRESLDCTEGAMLRVNPMLSAARTMCVPYAYLLLTCCNSKQVSRDKQNLMNNFPASGIGGLSRLADAVREGKMKMQLTRDLVGETGGGGIDWLMHPDQSGSMFVVVCGLHCVGVDCRKRLIWDCASPTAAQLTKENLHSVGVTQIDECRMLFSQKKRKQM